MNRSVSFFDTQFQHQIRETNFVLNPFEKLALPQLRSKVLDLGCGLGNLAMEPREAVAQYWLSMQVTARRCNKLPQTH